MQSKSFSVFWRVFKGISFSTLLSLSLILLPETGHSQGENVLNQRVDQFVSRLYFEGIQYVDAHALGPVAVPYLLKLLKNPSKKPFWVNIIVTLGFIESSEALDPLISFLETSEGEADLYAFKALLSVPFAIGCIASNGDPRALLYLTDKIDFPYRDRLRWSFRGKDVDLLISQQAITGLAVSGRPEGKEKLLNLRRQIEAQKAVPEQEAFLSHIKDGLETLNRIEAEGRSRIFNP